MSMRSALRSAMKFRRFATDALCALAIFVFLLATTSSDRSAAGGVRANDLVGLSDSAREPATGIVAGMPRSAASLTMVAIPDVQAQGESVFRRTAQQPALVVLAGVFSLLAAANLAFLRHLRRVASATPASARKSAT